MDSGNRISFLLDLYVANSCSKEELKELFRLIDENDHQADIQLKLREIWDATNPGLHHTDEEWDSLYAATKGHPEIALKPVRTFRLWHQLTAAAVLLAGLTAGLLFYTKSPLTSNISSPPQIAARKIAPGGNKAMLTLANGTKIVLDGNANGLIASQTGIRIIKAADGQLVYVLKDVKQTSKQIIYNTIETPRGGQYQISMPDGTKVWLNAMSSLTYPVAFEGRERKVELKGEAYFEVAKNKNAPFKVVSGHQEVQVLGTHFNINSYADEQAIQTTLLEGAVKVVSTTTGKTAVLAPGQQSDLQLNSIHVKSVDIEESVAWKNGAFIFNKDSLDYIMRQLSRWYNVEVVYQNEEVKQQLFSGTVSRFENAAEILDILELTRLVHFKVEGRRIIVMK